MKNDEMQVLKRLLKKLSALRTTLSDDERALLDQFIVTAQADDTMAHVFTGPAPAPNPRPKPRYDVVYDPEKEIYKIV